MALSIIGVCIFFLVMNWKLGVLAIILFSLNILIFFKISQKNIQKSIKKETDENKLIEEIDDSLHNSFSTITTGRIKQETNRINQKHSNFDVLHNDHMIQVFIIAGYFPKKFVIQGGHLKNPVTPSSYSTIL
jgi:ABC-type multidrug transport system fused ATPase/permease subunit